MVYQSVIGMHIYDIEKEQEGEWVSVSDSDVQWTDMQMSANAPIYIQIGCSDGEE